MGKKLQVSKDIDVRFSEVDSMGIVWHGNYALYFEDARELFGQTYNLQYMRMYEFGFFAPLVELTFHYKKAIRYQDKIRVTISYRDTPAAKIIFDYEITDLNTGETLATGQSTQVFLDTNYQLALQVPDFFIEWKKLNGIL